MAASTEQARLLLLSGRSPSTSAQCSRQRQATQPVLDERTGLNPSAASLRTDLELTRQEIKELRAERDKLRQNLQHQFGRQLGQLTHRDLVDRIDELTQHNQRLGDQNRQATVHNEQLQQRVTELEDNLAAARTSLRRMIRDNQLEQLAATGQVPQRQRRSDTMRPRAQNEPTAVQFRSRPAPPHGNR